ncbi:hypothetical protein GQ42DRAFT_5527 [Ramicandelaber brevisporus]|nr:hypothetical protein GQ42DRAFT_5527 [Ramicandelaber brevisporus]
MPVNLPPPHLVATRRSKTFYDDLHVSSNATPEQILEATVQKAFQLLESKRNEQGGLDPLYFNLDSRGLYSTFSILYGRYSRAAYDVFGDGLFAHFGIEYEISSRHPAYYWIYPESFPYIGQLLVVSLVIIIGALGWGVFIGEFISMFQKVFPAVFLVFYGLVCASKIVQFFERLITALNFIFGGLFGVCDYQRQNQQQQQMDEMDIKAEKVDVSSTQVEATQMTLLRVFGFRLLMGHWIVFNQNLFQPLVMVAVALRDFSITPSSQQQQQQQQQQENKEINIIELSIFAILFVVQTILQYNEQVYNSGLSQPHIRTLLQAMSDHIDSAYSAESDQSIREQLHDVINQEYENMQSRFFFKLHSLLTVFMLGLLCFASNLQEHLTFLAALIGHLKDGVLYYSLILFATLILSRIVVTVKGWFSAQSDDDQDK